MEKELQDEEALAEPVSAPWQSIINGRFSTKLDNKALADRLDAYNRPENCPALVVPTVNKEVWAENNH